MSTAMLLDPKPPDRLEARQHPSRHAGCGSYWLVVQTHPQAEQWAAQQLTRSGYHAYLPRILVSRRDRVIPTLLHRHERPLFSGYLFVRLGSTDPWSPIRHYRGVRQILMSGENPHHLSEAIIRAVQAGEALRRLPVPDTVLYAAGAPVTLAHGPFQGQDAVVVSVATTTARIALPLMGGMRELVVPIERLMARE